MKVIGIALFYICSFTLVGQPIQNKQESSFDPVEDLYNFVSVKKGEVHDWDKVRSLFIPEATIQPISKQSRAANTNILSMGINEDPQ